MPPGRRPRQPGLDALAVEGKRRPQLGNLRVQNDVAPLKSLPGLAVTAEIVTSASWHANFAAADASCRVHLPARFWTSSTQSHDGEGGVGDVRLTRSDGVLSEDP
eukprot:30559-Pyramimonas_sp.AAC.1